MKGIDYVALIGRILDSACRRIGPREPEASASRGPGASAADEGPFR